MHVYEIKHTVAHSADDMFRLVADVESYPKFLPLCEALKLKRRETRDVKEVLIATWWSVTSSSARASPPSHPRRRGAQHRRALSRRPFSYLENRWSFRPLTSKLARSISISLQLSLALA